MPLLPRLFLAPLIPPRDRRCFYFTVLPPLGAFSQSPLPWTQKEDVSPAKQRSNNDNFLLGLDSTAASPMITTTPSSPAAGGIRTSSSGGVDVHVCADLDAATATETAAVAVAVAAPAPAVSALEALQRPGVMAKALRMLSVDELLGDVPLVCAAWRKAAVYAFAEVASDMSVRDTTNNSNNTAAPAGAGGRALRGRVAKGKAVAVAAAAAVAARGAPSRDVWSVEKLMATFPWGGFLSEGACKQVSVCVSVFLWGGWAGVFWATDAVTLYEYSVRFGQVRGRMVQGTEVGRGRCGQQFRKAKHVYKYPECFFWKLTTSPFHSAV